MLPWTRRWSEGLLAAGSAGAVGGLTAMGVWELTAAPGFIAALAAAGAGACVYATGTLIERLTGRPPAGDD